MEKEANRYSFRRLRSATSASTLATFFFLSPTSSSFMPLFGSLVSSLLIIILNSAITICNTHVLFCAALVSLVSGCLFGCRENWGKECNCNRQYYVFILRYFFLSFFFFFCFLVVVWLLRKLGGKSTITMGDTHVFVLPCLVVCSWEVVWSRKLAK